MSNTQATAMLVGIIMPVIITLLKQAGLSRWWNLVIAFIACAGAGVLTVWATGQLTAVNILGTIAAVFVAAQVAYLTYWKGTDAEKALNEMTSLIKPLPVIEVPTLPNPQDVSPVSPSATTET